MSRISPKGFAAASIVASLLSSTSVLAQEMVPVQIGGELTIAIKNSPPNWNPLTARGDITTNRTQQWPLYPHPFLTLPDASVVLNDQFLTSASVVSTDPMVVEYVIRDEAIWSDGTPITVADFQYAQSTQDPKQCPDCSAAFTQGYELITKVEGSNNGKTVRMTFSQPYGPWRTLFPYLMPAHVAATYGDLTTSFNVGLAENVPTVSGGPFIVSEYEDGIAMTLVRNENWYGNPVHLDTVRFRYITKMGQQLTALQNGEIDVVYGGATLDTVEQVNQMFGYDVATGAALTYYHFSLKTDGGPLGDPVLRKAVATTLDTKDMTRRTVGQFVDTAEAMTSAAYIPGQKVNGELAVRDNTGATGIGSGNVEAAMAMLTEAGYSMQDGALYAPDGSKVPDVEVLTYSADPIRVQLAELAQAQLRAIGLTVFIDAADRSRYSPDMRAGKFDIMATGTAMDLGALSLAQWYQTGAARNSFGYSSPVVDGLIEEISVELDDARVVELNNELDLALLNDAIVVPLFPITNIAIYPSKFANLFVNPSKYGPTMNIEEWGIEAE